MSEVHLVPSEAQQQIATHRQPAQDLYVNGRHIPHGPSLHAVNAIMEQTGQQEYDQNFGPDIPEIVANSLDVRGPLESYHNHIFQGVEDAPAFDPVRAAGEAWGRHGDFLEAAPSVECLLDQVKQSLEDSLVTASRHQGFPLSSHQIHSRLRATILGFYDPSNTVGSGQRGDYALWLNRAAVILSPNWDEVRLDTKHELFHAISSQRYVNRPTAHTEHNPTQLEVTKVGFRNKHTGRWRNEAMTQIFAQIFDDPRVRHIQFDHPTATMAQIANGVIPEILGLSDDTRVDEDPTIYTDEKVAFINAYSDIPFNLLVNAFLIQDKDNTTGEGYAGAAAEKELWREMKRRGGIERIAQLRAIDAAFEAKDPEKARALALEVKKQNQSRRATLKRGVYGRQVVRNTKKVQRGIGQARAALVKAA